MSRNIPMIILLAAFAALQIADVVTTNQVLANGGWEGNPLQAWAMAHLGNYWAVPKLVLMTACAACMCRWRPKYVAPLVGIVGLVVSNNALWAYA